MFSRWDDTPLTHAAGIASAYHTYRQTEAPEPIPKAILRKPGKGYLMGLSTTRPMLFAENGKHANNASRLNTSTAPPSTLKLVPKAALTPIAISAALPI